MTFTRSPARRVLSLIALIRDIKENVSEDAFSFKSLDIKSLFIAALSFL